MSPFFRPALIILLLLAASGCSILRVDPNDVLKVDEAVEIERDAFKKVVYFQGPVVTNEAEDASNSPEVEDISLRATQEQNKPARFFLTITDYYDGDWRGFDQAFDSAGAKFHALATRHKVQCTFLCGYEEVLEVELTRKYLDDHIKNGITMRLYGPSGFASAVFTLPGPYVEGFLKGSFVE